jgi:hypothetical protein
MVTEGGVHMPIKGWVNHLESGSSYQKFVVERKGGKTASEVFCSFVNKRLV